jgi:RmlD substrate binding domain
VNVIITGHTGGLGSALLNKYKERGCTTFGASKSTGYDFADPQVAENFCKQLQGHDVLINTITGVAQRNVFEKMYSIWQGKQKVIVNIGSRATQYHMSPSMHYGADKAALDYLAYSAQVTGWPWPAILHIRPGYFDSKRSQHKPNPKMKTSDVVDVVMWMIDNVDKFRVLDMVISK